MGKFIVKKKTERNATINFYLREREEGREGGREEERNATINF